MVRVRAKGQNDKDPKNLNPLVITDELLEDMKSDIQLKEETIKKALQFMYLTLLQFTRGDTLGVT